MKITHEALCVQKNASQLINELLYTLQEFDIEGYKTDGDSLFDLYNDKTIWDVNKWTDEETMNEHRSIILVLKKLFDWSEMIETMSYRTDKAVNNVEQQLPDLVGQQRANDIDELINERGH